MKVDLTRLMQLDRRLHRASIAMNIVAGLCVLLLVLVVLVVLVGAM